MTATPRVRSDLWEKATRLPVARIGDFTGGRKPPRDADPNHLRVIADSALRARLILAGMAESLQSTKGRQRFKSIVRLYPNGEAPRNNTKLTRATVTPIAARPTVEQMAKLLTRITEVENEVAKAMRSDTSTRIERLKKRLGALNGDAFERAYEDLRDAVQEHRDLAQRIRDEAFQRIERDTTFEPRRHLRLLTAERR